MHRGKVGSLGRPLHEGFGPVSTVDNRFGLLVSLVPENADAVTTVHDELVTTVVVTQPPAQVLLLLERFNLGGRVVLVDAALATKALNVGQLVDSHGVLLVQRGAVQGLDGGLGLCGRLVLDKGVALGHVGLVADGHEDEVLAGLASSGELAEDKLDQLCLALLGNLGEAIDDYERVETLLHAHIELLAQICRTAVSITTSNFSPHGFPQRARRSFSFSVGDGVPE